MRKSSRSKQMGAAMTMAILAMATAALTACQRGTKGSADGSVATHIVPPSAAEGAVVDSADGEVVKDSSASPVVGKWITDANALSLLSTIDARQIAAADIELKTWHLDSVRAFAAAVAREHADIQHSADSLANALHLTPIAPALAQPLAAAMQSQLDSMTSAKGSALDRAFVREQVASQTMILQYVQQLSSVAERPEVQGLMASAASQVDAQLTRARALQGTFAIADSTAAAAAADSAARRAERRKR